MDQQFWHARKSKQFLKNIDTFYYAVFFDQDFTPYSQDVNVINLRKFCSELKKLQDAYDLDFGKKDKYHVSYIPGSFSCYSVRFMKPEFFDFFLAPQTLTDTTPHAIMQLRSRPLWEDGVYAAFDESMKFVKAFAESFGLTIREVRENRCDFACHSNYLHDPQKFFQDEHFAKMWVGKVGRDKDHFRQLNSHSVIYDDDEIEKDYIAIGKRGDNCFIRIYLKSKEVVQQGYKGYFLKLWYLSGLISRYDLWCLEEAYKRKSWAYLPYAQLDWALQNDDELSDGDKKYIKDLLEADKADFNVVRKAAKKYTKPVTKIFNIEFQCMRGMSKSFELIHKPQNTGVCGRVYDYLDNYELIYEYLTRVSMRLVRTDCTDTNKSRRENCEFWERLRKAKTIDFKKSKKDVTLIRKYSSNINLEVRKKRAISSVSSFGYAMTQDDEGNILDDMSMLISIMNDNDLAYIDQHKKKLKQRNAEVIPDEQKVNRDVLLRFIINNNP